jgi:hypothetical protein
MVSTPATLIGTVRGGFNLGQSEGLVLPSGKRRVIEIKRSRRRKQGPLLAL